MYKEDISNGYFALADYKSIPGEPYKFKCDLQYLNKGPSVNWSKQADKDFGKIPENKFTGLHGGLVAIILALE